MTKQIQMALNHSNRCCAEMSQYTIYLSFSPKLINKLEYSFSGMEFVILSRIRRSTGLGPILSYQVSLAKATGMFAQPAEDPQPSKSIPSASGPIRV